MLSFISVFVLLLAKTQCVEFIIKNFEGGPVWVGIQGNTGKAHLANGGFILNQGQSRSVSAPDNWAGRFWPRTYCDPNTKCCATGDCGCKVECAGAGGNPPATLLEITLRGAGGLDFYDISFVDGSNIRASIEPVNGRGNGGHYSCKKAGCSVNLLDQCPQELRQTINGNTVVGCKSACLAFHTDQYCCSGAHNTPETCKSSSWPVNYPEFFKSKCPDAYSYAYDDHKSTFTCIANQYIITFGR